MFPNPRGHSSTPPVRRHTDAYRKPEASACQTRRRHRARQQNRRTLVRETDGGKKRNRSRSFYATLPARLKNVRSFPTKGAAPDGAKAANSESRTVRPAFRGTARKDSSRRGKGSADGFTKKRAGVITSLKDDSPSNKNNKSKRASPTANFNFWQL